MTKDSDGEKLLTNSLTNILSLTISLTTLKSLVMYSLTKILVTNYKV